MTSTEQQRVEEIAGKLTEAQRLAILTPALSHDSPAVHDLARLGLAWRISAHFDFRGDWVSGGWQLRKFGLALRAHLKDQAS